MLVYNNIVCITGAELLDLGVKEGTYKSWTQRNSITVVRKGGGPGRPALIAYDSLPDDVKIKAEKVYGPKPELVAETKDFKETIGIDRDAQEFYRTYQVAGKHLHDKNQAAYVVNANILNALHSAKLMAEEERPVLGLSMRRFWPDASKMVNHLKAEFKHTLPSNHRELQKKYNQYIAGYKLYGKPDYEALVNGRYGNKNTEKLCTEAKEWLIAMYSLPIKKLVPQLWVEYNMKAESMGWEPLKSENTIDLFLNKPEVRSLWYAPRHGKVEAAGALKVILKTRLPEKRDVLWYSDGTKLNFFFKNPNATSKKDYSAKATVYVVMDVYSECILGWNIAPTEDHISQVKAMKMAMNTSGRIPQEWRTDNQGGHKKMETNNVFDKVAELMFNTKPNHARAKTIESMFGRFQMQVQRGLWYYTGQNITSKKLDSKANMEFILENLAELPTLEQAINDFAACVEKWNSKPHFKYERPRAELYATSVNDNTRVFEIWDAMEAFWVKHETPGDRGLRYTNDGLKFKLKNQSYHYEVYANGGIDWDFVDSYLDERFVVKYDPDDMSQVALYYQDAKALRFVAIAQEKRSVARATADITGEEAKHMRAVNRTNDERMKQNQEGIQQIWERTGISPQQLVQPTTIGQYNKLISNAESEDEAELEPVEVTATKPKRKSIYDKW